MSRINKYKYLYVIQGNYGSRWEDVSYEDNYKDARRCLKDYLDNEKQYPHRLITRRELNKEFKK